MSGRLRLFAGVAAALAVVRYFGKGLLAPLGLPDFVGSLLASLWLLLGVSLFAFFGHQGRTPSGRWVSAALFFVALAAWCEALTIGGIVLSDLTGADTYFCPIFEEVAQEFPTAGEHALGHVIGFFPRTAFALLFGTGIYWVARRRR